MVFNEKSFSVQFWLKQLKEGKTIEDVPKLFNLREVVQGVLGE